MASSLEQLLSLLQELPPQQVPIILNTTPALAVPPGATAGFVDPSTSNRAAFISTVALVLSLTTTCVFIRIYTKLYIIRRIGWDDYTCVLAWLMYIGYIIAWNFLHANGGGTHQWNLSIEQAFKMLHWANIVEILYAPSIFLIKLSILIQYLKIFVPFRGANRLMFLGTHLVIWANAIFYLVLMFLEIFACTPREAIWNLLIPADHCFSTNAFLVAPGVLNIISDFTILLLPICCIWKLQMPLKKKLQVSAVFGFGFCACVVAVVHMYITVHVVQNPDATYNVLSLGLYTLIENAIGIICSCMPAMPAFFRFLMPKIHHTSVRYNSGFSGHQSTRFELTRTTTNNNNNTGNIGGIESGSLAHTYYALKDRIPLAETKTTSTELLEQTEKPPSNFAALLTIPKRVTVRHENGQRIRRGEEELAENGILRTVHIQTEREEQEHDAHDVESQKPKDWQ